MSQDEQSRSRPLSPVRRLLLRNLRSPRALMRKLVIGDAISDMPRDRMRARGRSRVTPLRQPDPTPPGTGTVETQE